MNDNKGFTLIELLAVITIMGILMMVAIPTVSRTIENSRKDTFIDTAKKYADSAQTMWMGDNLSCMSSEGKRYSSSAVPTGTYYIEIDTASENVPVLLEQGGKSSWGNRDIKGYVMVLNQYCLYGDVNCNGDIDSTDYLMFNSIKNGTVTATDFQRKAADVDGDGVISSDDKNLIRDYFTFVISSFPASGGSGDLFAASGLTFYVSISDGVHGINKNSSVFIEPEKLVRGDLEMSGVTYDSVSIPDGAFLCVER
jgi:prepilin-type N-terminal cleavage/methylation domain-containing protein